MYKCLAVGDFEPRTTCLMLYHRAMTVNRYMNTSILFVTVNDYCYANVSFSTDQWNFHSLKDFFLRGIFLLHGL